MDYTEVGRSSRNLMKIEIRILGGNDLNERNENSK